MKVSVLIRQLAESMKAYVDRQTSTLQAEIKAIPHGQNGKDGRDGVDGKDAPAVNTDAVIKAVLEQVPIPVDGKDGQDGKDGRDGVDGKDALPVNTDEIVKAVLEQAPIPVNGRNGVDGKDGHDGKDGRNGVDGKSFTLEEAQALIEKAVSNRQIEWALDFERRAQELFQRAIERMPVPKNGSDGRDAVDVEGFDVKQDGRTLTISLQREGKVIAEKSIRVPGFEDRGVYREDSEYEKGDCVSFGGNLYIAQKDSAEGKPGNSPDWRLAVRRGRDGRESVARATDKNAAVKYK